MNTICKYLVFSSLFLAFSGCVQKEPDPIRVAFFSWWNDLVPPLQNNYNASLIVVNIFQPLLEIDDSGQFTPVGALSWKVSDDFKTFRFTINVKNKFSDGTPLSANDYKRSWEDGLKMKASAHNHSLSDVLYKVKGFKEFKKTGQLSGLKVESNDTIEIQFESPFRQALDEISGARFAAYKKTKNGYIGSGAFLIESSNPSSQKTILRPNPFFFGKVPKAIFELSVVKSEEVVSSLKEGKIDVFMGAYSPKNIEKIEGTDAFVIHFGQYTTHSTLALNGMENRFFSDSRSRLGFQYLVLKAIESEKNSEKGFRKDIQFFLPSQMGRISLAESRQLVINGKRYESHFRKKNKVYPLFFVHGSKDQYIFNALKKMGVNFTPKSGSMAHSKVDFSKEFKTEFRTDVISSTFSVNQGDPDGVYHKLGKHGAIHTPTVYREKVSTMLDQGRSLSDRGRVDPFYQDVSREILKAVPMIHIGFFQSVLIYNSQKLKRIKSSIKSNNYDLNNFESRNF